MHNGDDTSYSQMSVGFGICILITSLSIILYTSYKC